MSGSPKEKLRTEEGEEEVKDEREVYLRDGRTLKVSDEGGEQLVEIRNESGMLELRIKLTDQGPVLQMESVKLQLKATEAVEIDAKKVAINGSESLQLHGGEVKLEADEEVKVDAAGDVRVKGKIIWLN